MRQQYGSDTTTTNHFYANNVQVVVVRRGDYYEPYCNILPDFEVDLFQTYFDAYLAARRAHKAWLAPRRVSTRRSRAPVRVRRARARWEVQRPIGRVDRLARVAPATRPLGAARKRPRDATYRDP